MNFIQAGFRFYAELNDFLSPEKRQVSFVYQFAPASSIKDIIEAIGIPHTEVDLILANGQSVDFLYQPKENDQIAVYPVFESMDIYPVIRLRPEPLRNPQFILDVHLGKLARLLRLLGFDALYQSTYSDQQIVDIALAEKRIILTRDKGILKNKKVTHGYWLRATQPHEQIREIIYRFDLARMARPFSRCLECNGTILLVSDSGEVMEQIPDQVKKMQNQFYRCENCKRIYWQGTHYEKLNKLVNNLLQRI